MGGDVNALASSAVTPEHEDESFLGAEHAEALIGNPLPTNAAMRTRGPITRHRENGVQQQYALRCPAR